jgi:MFS family permease
MLLGLGFTFFSGAVQAWLVDALKERGYTGTLDAVLAKGEIVEGVAMLGGSVAGGFLAQATNLGVPYAARAAVLAATFVVAFLYMRDVGFTRTQERGLWRQAKGVLNGALEHGVRNPPVRWVMVANLFTDGVSIYAFYAMQPYLLALYGDPTAYGIAGLAAAIVGGAQIGGGLLVPRLARVFRRRTSVLMGSVAVSTAALLVVGTNPPVWAVIALLAVWGLVFAMVMPIRQAYVNDLIPSNQRATILSIDSLVGSGGGVVAQPLLGRAADVWGYPASYAVSAAIQACAIPALWLARRRRAPSDRF